MASSATKHAAWQRFTSALQSTLSLDEVGEAFINNVGDILDADAHGLYRFGSGGFIPVEVLCDAEHEFLDRYETFGRDDDPVLRVALELRCPIDSSRAVPEPEWQASGARAALGESNLAHSLEAPLVAAGTVVGTINFARMDSSGSFAEHELTTAQYASEQLGRAIERGIRFEETGRRVSVLESALNRVPEGVVVSDLDAQVLFRNRAAERWLGEACGGHPAEELQKMITEAGEEFRHGRRVHVGSVRDTDDRHMMVKSWLLGERRRAVVTVVNADEQDDNHRLPLLAVLSAREQQIAQLVSEGLTTRMIAERAFISENTVKQHLKRVFAKTGVRNRAELVQLMWSAGARRS